jgi:hypothetical protein
MEDEDIPSYMVRVWDFTQAPKALRELSKHGGDEDYIVIGIYKPMVEMVCTKLSDSHYTMHRIWGQNVGITTHA